MRLAIDDLGSNEREITRRVLLQGQPLRETAGMLKIPLGQLERRMDKIKLRLRRALKDFSDHRPGGQRSSDVDAA